VLHYKLEYVVEAIQQVDDACMATDHIADLDPIIGNDARTSLQRSSQANVYGTHSVKHFLAQRSQLGEIDQHRMKRSLLSV